MCDQKHAAGIHDADAKADPAAFQRNYLVEVGKAVEASLPPAGEDPAYLDETAPPDVFDAMWTEAGQ